MVVRMRATRAHRNNRRSHHVLQALRVVVDTAMKTPHLRHRASLVTGMYRGKQVLTMKAPLKKAKGKVEKKK